MAFLERDIKARKQAFGIIVYDILRSNSIASTTPSATISAADVQRAFEECRGDIEALEDKLRSKRREMEAIDGGHVGGGGGAGALVGEDAEAPGIPQNP
ncbi:hypothetical protein ACHAW5_007173 [Stephanodiscus triporus]|uniref:Uncharacterized protein n=1 Tax=Stephanodiscus triporus TaxID=2934178 RepID=A0ABD3P1A1_9STRA